MYIASNDTYRHSHMHTYTHTHTPISTLDKAERGKGVMKSVSICGSACLNSDDIEVKITGLLS